MNLKIVWLPVCVWSGILSCAGLDWKRDIRVHCANDTVSANRILSELHSLSLPAGERVLSAAKSLAGIPYEAHTLESAEGEQLTLNLCSADCITFVEAALSLAKASGKNGCYWTDFARALENIRYRKGTLGDYSSRLHYVSEWATDNIYRGNLTDITPELGTDGFMTKSLSYMSRHPELYPALSDSVMLERIKSLEMGFCNYKIPFLRKESLSKKKTVSSLENGDIILFLTKDPDLDATHAGIIEMRNGVPHLVHASSIANKTIIEQRPLADYLRHEGRGCAGVRILRITD